MSDLQSVFDTLKPLLSRDVFRNFTEAISRLSMTCVVFDWMTEWFPFPRK